MSLFAQAFVTLLVVMDPMGNVPVFLALTRTDSAATRRRLGLQATLVAASVVFAFAVFGEEILRGLGISIAALEVAGGLILAAAALELLQSSSSRRPQGDSAVNIALVPLGTPLLAGPGAIAATMVFVRRAHGFGQVVLVLAALVAVLVVIYVSLRYADWLSRLLRDSGIEMLTRIVGLLLVAIAVQMVATGVQFGVHHPATLAAPAG